MPPKLAGKPKIAIVGAGNLGSALAVSLRAVQYRISEVVSRSRKTSRRGAKVLARRVGARAVAIGESPIVADVVWLCAPDGEIRRCAEALAASGDWTAKIVLHSSGALGSGELRALQRRGAAVASVHPLMTFVPGEPPALHDVPFAVEGDASAVRTARRLVRGLGGKPFGIQPKQKAGYHTWGAFASPLLLSMLVTAERVAEASGIPRAQARKKMLPIVRQTIANYDRYGSAGAFSGPIIRGDSATVAKHLRILRALPEARDVYLALARSALRNLPARNKKQLLKILG